MIYACMVLYNRLDLLEIWLNELREVVDHFVIVESAVTHTGGGKPLYFKDVANQFSNFPITYIPITNSSNIPAYDGWNAIEKYLTESILKGLTNCKDDDLILFSHNDEILRPSSLSEICCALDYIYEGNPNLLLVGRLELFQYRYWFNCHLHIPESFRGAGPVIANYHTMKKIGLGNAKQIMDERNFKIIYLAGNGGWHYSWLGPINFIKEKLKTNTDQSYIREEFFNDEYIYKIMNTGGDILNEARSLGKWFEVSWTDPNDSNTARRLFPLYVLKNLKKFQYLIKSG